MRLIYIVIFLAFAAELTAAQPPSVPLHLNAGDSYVFEVNGFVPSGFDSSKVGLQGFNAELSFGPDIITYPERLHAEYYENVLGGAWWMKNSIGVLPGETRSSTGDGVYYNYATSRPFNDLQGVVYLWMETGSVDVKSLNMVLAQNGQLYQQTFTLPVPEPASAFLAGMISTALLTIRSGRRYSEM